MTDIYDSEMIISHALFLCT